VTTTLIQSVLILLVVGAGAMIIHTYRENTRRRDREIVRRIQKYLDQLPPARPW
jgi:hypothetical protein